MSDELNGREARREFLKTQLKRISALWPLVPSPEALDEYARILYGYTDEEIAQGFDQVIDTHQELAAPKPVHVRTAVAAVAKVRRRIPPTEFERDELGLKSRELEAEQRELRRIETWMARTPEAKEHYESQMAHLLEHWPPDKHELGRRILHAGALISAYESLGSPLILTHEGQ